MNEAYTTFDVMRILDIDRERLREWMKRKFVHASIQQTTGKGSKSLFSRTDVYRIAIFRKMVLAGFPRAHAARYSLSIDDEMFTGGPEKDKRPQYYFFFRQIRRGNDRDEYLMVRSTTLGFFDQREVPVTLRQLHDQNLDDCYVLNLSKIFKEVDERL